MEARRGAISCVFVIVLITIQTEVEAVTAGEGSSSALAVASGGRRSTYEARKRHYWNKFLHFMENHQPPLTLERCSGAHVIEFLKYVDTSSRTQVHVSDCPHFGNPKPPARCACPFKRTWQSLHFMIKTLRAAYKDTGGRPESNPFSASAVKIYLGQVMECEVKARGIPYQRKKRNSPTASEAGASSGGAGSEWVADIFFI